MNLDSRASKHLALSDPRRLEIVDALEVSDCTVGELAELVAMSGNLLAHHLDVLEGSGLIERHASEGDRRRRYVSLLRDAMPHPAESGLGGSRVAFVCTHNSARSQFAAALWRRATGADVVSAGSDPSLQVHPKAVKVASEYDIDISTAVPSGYDSIPWRPELVVTVCDRALEAGVPRADTRAHWSIPDPVLSGDVAAFRASFAEIARRVGNATVAEP